MSKNVTGQPDLLDIEDIKSVLVEGDIVELNEALLHYDLRQKDAHGYNILHYFIKLCASSKPPQITNAWQAVIDLLISKGIDIEEKQEKGNGCSALHLAVLLHLQKITEYLIILGADVNATNSRDKPILFTALMSNNLNTVYWFVEKLVQSGANTNYELSEKQTIKDFALNIANRNFSQFFSK